MSHKWDIVDEENWDSDRDEIWDEIKDEVDMEREEWEYFQNVLDYGSIDEEIDSDDKDEW